MTEAVPTPAAPATEPSVVDIQAEIAAAREELDASLSDLRAATTPAALAQRGGRGDLAGKGKAGCLTYRQRIHVGPEHNNRSVSVSVDSDDPVAADSGSHLEAKFPEGISHLCSRFELHQ